MWEEVRAEFPALSNWTFLNTATYGQTPRRAEEAIRAHIERRNEYACADFLGWYDDIDELRGMVAKLIHCEAEDIAFIHNASAGLATFLNGVDWREGDEVLTIENEFPNNLYQSPILKRFGVQFRVVPWEQLMASCNANTRAVLVSAINYGTGFRAPIEELSAEFQKRGVLFYVDGTQGCGAVQFDMRALRPAVFAVDAYKWMLTPNGAGFLYVNPAVRASITPSMAGWRSDKDWRQVNNLNHGNPVFSPDAERYEGGQVPFPSLYAMKAVVGMMLEIGPAKIEARALELADQTREILAAAGGEVNREASPIVTAKFEGRDAGELALRLKEKRILASARHGRLRVSTHFYNNEADLDVLRKAL
jgi:cysteine desulfurase/selenocysteine lyase